MANTKTKTTDTVEIPLTSPDGRPWVASSEIEAMELMSQGYRRTDGGKQAPPAESAGKKGEPATAAAKPGPNSTT